ncbi:MAG: MltF family protein [Candidatus Eutrophobiaceae bacterium]
MLCYTLLWGMVYTANAEPCPHIAVQSWHDGLSSSPAPAELPFIGKRSTLRVLFHQEADANFCKLSLQEAKTLRTFAEQESLQLRWFHTDDLAQMPTLLAQRQVDILAADIGITINKHFLQTPAWRSVRQKLVERSMRSNTDRGIEALRGRHVAARPQFPTWDILNGIAKTNTGMQLVKIPADASDQEILEYTLIGKYDTAVLDNLALEVLLPKYPGLVAEIDITEPRLMTWTLHPQAHRLLESLTKFIKKEAAAQRADQALFDEIAPFSKNRPLRIITNIEPAHYYLAKGRQRGYEYEMLKQFTQSKGLQLEVVLADSLAAMKQLLAERKGDLIAASIPKNYAMTMQNALPSKSYLYVVPLLVRIGGEKNFLDPGYLHGKIISLPATSPWLDWLQRFRGLGNEFEVTQTNGAKNAELTGLMSDMEQSLTVIGSHQLQTIAPEQQRQLQIYPLGEPVGLVWVARAQDRKLVQELNVWIEENYRGETFNVIWGKYFEAIGHGKPAMAQSPPPLSPWSELIAKYAETFGFDRFLITALIYQESQFDPKALSSADARGLMQLTDAASRFMRVDNPENPEESISGGIGYLNYLRERLDEDILLEERVWFSLAAYNAGINRVRQARRLAADMGLDNTRWFSNVENAMLKLAQPYAKKGKILRRCRCGQTVIYVREIRTRYHNYLRYSRKEAVPNDYLYKG